MWRICLGSLSRSSLKGVDLAEKRGVWWVNCAVGNGWVSGCMMDQGLYILFGTRIA